MSKSEDYEYEYDESDQEAMDDGGGGGNGGSDDEEQSFEYTDCATTTADDGEIALENAYYNTKSERDPGELYEARETFESVVRMEVEQNKKAAGIAVDDADGDDHDNDGESCLQSRQGRNC